MDRSLVHVSNTLLLKPRKQRLIDITSFSLPFVFFLSTNNFGFVFQIFLIVEFTRPNFRNTSAFFFSFTISRMILNIPSTLKTFIFPQSSHVVTISVSS